MKNLHNNLKQIRIEKGLTQEEVAEKIGLTRQAISGYESGKRLPSIDILTTLAEVYEVSIESILYGQKNKIKQRRIKQVAFAIIALFLTLQLLSGMFLILSFVLYPIEEGIVTGEQVVVLEKHFELSNIATQIEAIGDLSLTIGTFIVLALDLTANYSYSWKQKLAFFSVSLALSGVIAALLSALHPVYRTADFLFRGPYHFINIIVFLLIDLIISALKRASNK